MRVLGVNTGTSVDAIDFALIDWHDIHNLKNYSVIREDSVPFDPTLRIIFEKLINKQNGNLDEISNLNFAFSRFLAESINSFKEKHNEQIDLIGIHGQTIFHGKESTWQLGEGSLVANLTNINTVSDFRPADMARGGGGAPLISFLDDRLVRSDNENIATLNIGGIANITVLVKDSPCIAYDTGPGNTLIDNLCQKLYSKPFDKNGEIAFKGKINEKFVDNLIKNTEYFRLPPPKSTGRELFNHKFADKFLDLGNTQNIISSATYLTAKTISTELQKYPINKVLISGGGINNNFLTEKLKELNPAIAFSDHNQCGIMSQYKEAILFSLLAYTSYNRMANNVPSSTGAKASSILGKISYV
jgi:anhydro-N-acetylmuramic acid kinase